ncbi:MAG: FAD-dependent oxidoreductase [Candidatus Omnitrophica bacterium]|nr:FAD-dependent oxidoreductase [Candidatus Omnitrophota bacterium]
MLQPRPTVQHKEKRLKNFEEVSQGLAKRVCFEEAKRCPQCSDPTCKPGCPLGIDIPGFIRLLREGETTQALQKIQEENDFPAICGRVCLAPCEKSCVLEKEGAAIGIRALERFAADHGKTRSAMDEHRRPRLQRVAIVGSGPAGLAAAARLSRRGYAVTVFEASALVGGILRYGVPEFRLPRQVLDQEIEGLKTKGVQFQTNAHLGRMFSISKIFEQGFAAILLAVGTGAPRLGSIPGEELAGVYYGRELLMKIHLARQKNLMKNFPMALGAQVVVLGDGYLAVDCARVCARRQTQVSLVFSRAEEELKIHAQDREDMMEEGIQIMPSTQVLEIISNSAGAVSGVRCVRMDFADPFSDGNWQLVAVPDSEFIIDAQTVVLASAESQVTPLQHWIPELRIQNERIWIDSQTAMTSMQGVFAAGDVVTGAGRLVDALASGKRVAENIDEYLKAK